MSATSRYSIKLVAAAIWFSGAFVLLIKGGSLLTQALALRPEQSLTWLAVPAGLVIGGIKTQLIFDKVCRRNLDRIAALDRPQIWQAYRPGFYLFLVAMIALAGGLSGLAQGNYPGLIAMAVLDFSLATALFASGRSFQHHRR